MNIQSLTSLMGVQNGTSTSGTNTNSNGGLFDQMLNSVNDLNSSELKSQTDVQNVLSGNSNNLQGVLIEMEKAQLQMSLATQVRDKITQAYQTFQNMQI